VAYGSEEEDWKGMLVYLGTALNALRLLKMTRYFLGTRFGFLKSGLPRPSGL
jgi:hypothetical protein